MEKLIGFSTAEVLAIRQEMPDNPLLKEKLKNVCTSCTTYLPVYMVIDKYFKWMGIEIVVVHTALRFCLQA